MDKISEDLIQLSNQLDQAGKFKCADIIDDLLKSRSLHKISQYVGVIGYVLKQNRAMGNCIRKKRVASSKPMQDVVLECLSEYQDGQQYGNNNWTAKYAEVIKQVPDKFESMHIDFLQAIYKENQLLKHMINTKKAQKALETENWKTNIVSNILTSLENLEKKNEYNKIHLPFKIAAPKSPRGNWSRLFAPSWTRHGKDKDTKFEMDDILKSLVNIQSYQQMYETTDNKDQVDYAIQNEIQSLQFNMNNLRQRETIRGIGTESAVEEFEDLNHVLMRLYTNPLDEKALYYARKLHSRLEDALNLRKTTLNDDYRHWIQSTDTSEEVDSSMQDLTEDSSKRIAKALSQIIRKQDLSLLIEAFENIASNDINNRSTILSLINALSQEQIQVTNAPAFEMNDESAQTYNLSHSPLEKQFNAKQNVPYGQNWNNFEENAI